MEKNFEFIHSRIFSSNKVWVVAKSSRIQARMKKNLNLIPRNRNNSLTAVFFVCFPMIGSNGKRTYEEFSNQRIASITNDAPRLENRTITIFPVPLRVTRIYSRTECKTRAITSTNTTVQFLASWQKKRRRLPIPLNEGTIYHSGVL